MFPIFRENMLFRKRSTYNTEQMIYSSSHVLTILICFIFCIRFTFRQLLNPSLAMRERERERERERVYLLEWHIYNEQRRNNSYHSICEWP